jgi:hypothetical protein
MNISRRNALIAGLSTTAALGAAGCAGSQPTSQAQPVVVSNLGGVLVNAHDFGITGNKSDETKLLQNAIDFAHEHGLILYLPTGSYMADGLVLRDHTRIVGAGPELSVISAVPGSKNEAVFTVDSGRVRNVLLEGIGLEGSGNGEQHGIHVFSRRNGSDADSGLWHSDFKDLSVANFGGAQIWFQGGGEDALDPVQFLTMVNVVLVRRNDSNRSIGLLMSGQVNQTVWLNGRIDGAGRTSDNPGVNVKICRQLDHYDPAIDGSTNYLSNRTGHSHLFANVSFQKSELAALIDNCESITFDTCHFEDLGSGVLFSGVGQNRVDRSHFANSASGSDESFSIRAINGALVSGSANVFLGEYGAMASADDSGSVAALSDTLGNTLSVTQNLTRTIDPAEEIAVGGASTVALKGSPNAVRVIHSSQFPGESIVFKAAGGSVFFEAGGNIDFEGTSSPLEISSGGTLTLVRFGGSPEWAIGATHGAR